MEKPLDNKSQCFILRLSFWEADMHTHTPEARRAKLLGDIDRSVLPEGEKTALKNFLTSWDLASAQDAANKLFSYLVVWLAGWSFVDQDDMKAIRRQTVRVREAKIKKTRHRTSQKNVLRPHLLARAVGRTMWYTLRAITIKRLSGWTGEQDTIVVVKTAVALKVWDYRRSDKWHDQEWLIEATAAWLLVFEGMFYAQKS